MILVTRLDRQSMYLNPDHIISVEETPDTVITLFNGHHILVREHARVILNRIVAYRAKIIKRANAVSGRSGHLRRHRLRGFSASHAGQLPEPAKPGAAPVPLHHQDC